MVLKTWTVAVTAALAVCAIIVSNSCCSATETADAAALVTKIESLVNAGDRNGFIELFDTAYNYNGEGREALIRYFFTTEGGGAGNNQTLSVKSVTPEKGGVAFDYSRCSRFGGKWPVTICGGGTGAIESGANGLISAFRPVITWMAVKDTPAPEISDVKVNGKAAAISAAQPDIEAVAGDTLKIECRVSGDIASVSLTLGTGLQSTEMLSVAEDKSKFVAELKIGANVKPGRYFLMIKPYTAEYNKLGAGSVSVATVPVLIKEPNKSKNENESLPQIEER